MYCTNSTNNESRFHSFMVSFQSSSLQLLMKLGFSVPMMSSYSSETMNSSKFSSYF